MYEAEAIVNKITITKKELTENIQYGKLSTSVFLSRLHRKLTSRSCLLPGPFPGTCAEPDAFFFGVGLFSPRL